MASTREHVRRPGLFGFSVRCSPGRSLEELIAAGAFSHPTVSVTRLGRLKSAAEKAGYTVAVVPSPGTGYHATVQVPYPLPADLAQALSDAFDRARNPTRRML